MRSFTSLNRVDRKSVLRSTDFRDMVALVPLEWIGDEYTYRAAIEVLDRLFHLTREMSRDEAEYFRALAELAFEYECDEASIVEEHWVAEFSGTGYTG